MLKIDYFEKVFARRTTRNDNVFVSYRNRLCHPRFTFHGEASLTNQVAEFDGNEPSEPHNAATNMVFSSNNLHQS
jgi:hypothetical protein